MTRDKYQVTIDVCLEQKVPIVISKYDFMYRIIAWRKKARMNITFLKELRKLLIDENAK